jgi:prophage regulatory protein
MPTKILRLPSVKAITGLSRSSIYKKVSDGTFPVPVRLGVGARAVGWYECQVNEWLESLSATAPAAVLEAPQSRQTQLFT